MKILHLVQDEKFIDSAIEQFDSIDFIHNEYARLDGTGPFNYIKSKRVLNKNIGWLYENCILNKTFDIIILHNLYSCPIKYIHQIHPDIKIIWKAWGFDLYDNHWPAYPLIKIKNKYKERKIYHMVSSIKQFLLFLPYEIIKNKFHSRKYFNRAIKRIDYFAGVIPEEYELICKNKIFKAKPFLFSYSVKKYIREEILLDINLNKNNIQVGNALHYQLNHIDTLKKLKKLILPSETKIIVPLSYGGLKYRPRIIKFGNKMFGDKFIPLINYVPLNEYNEILKSVNIAIFNTERQYAIGNIFMLLWHGAKLFFPKNSLNYKYLINQGFRPYSIEDDLNNKQLNTSLNREEIINNRILLIKISSYENIQKELMDSLTQIKLICKNGR